MSVVLCQRIEEMTATIQVSESSSRILLTVKVKRLVAFSAPQTLSDHPLLFRYGTRDCLVEDPAIADTWSGYVVWVPPECMSLTTMEPKKRERLFRLERYSVGSFQVQPHGLDLKHPWTGEHSTGLPTLHAILGTTIQHLHMLSVGFRKPHPIKCMVTF